MPPTVAIGMNPEMLRRLGEVDPTKLLGYFGSVLPVAELDFQVKFVLDRDRWLRDCIAIIEAELSPLRLRVAILARMPQPEELCAFPQQTDPVGPSGVMHIYRCYFLNADDHIQVFEVIEVASLREGIDRALEMLKARPQHRSVELWDRSRRVYPARYGNILPGQRRNH